MRYKNMLYILPVNLLFLLVVLFSAVPVDAEMYEIPGYFDAGSGTWDRRMATAVSAAHDCDTASSDSVNNGVRYTQYRIVPNVNGNLEAAVISSASGLDTMMALYCEPFDPSAPQDNLLTMDDDGNGYPNPSLTSRDIELQQGKSYYLVVTSYSNYNPGDPTGSTPLDGEYTLELADHLVHVNSLKDGLIALQLVAGMNRPLSAIKPLFDTSNSYPDNGKVTLARAIHILQNLAH